MSEHQGPSKAAISAGVPCSSVAQIYSTSSPSSLRNLEYTSAGSMDHQLPRCFMPFMYGSALVIRYRVILQHLLNIEFEIFNWLVYYCRLIDCSSEQLLLGSDTARACRTDQFAVRITAARTHIRSDRRPRGSICCSDRCCHSPCFTLSVPSEPGSEQSPS